MGEVTFTRSSAIEAMHARYEGAHVVMEALHAALALEPADKFAMERALVHAQGEADALHIAILYQVPDEWREAVILQHHVAIAVEDFVLNEISDADPLRAALCVGSCAVTDYLRSERIADTSALGAMFEHETERTYQMRRLRTGALEMAR